MWDTRQQIDSTAPVRTGFTLHPKPRLHGSSLDRCDGFDRMTVVYPLPVIADARTRDRLVRVLA
ncbi:hypothetical protein NY08_408 [Rhodococcus sp. B7740]|nr:hypothetical protein NY08_408 [Rhodococcus sp. B7740]